MSSTLSTENQQLKDMLSFSTQHSVFCLEAIEIFLNISDEFNDSLQFSFQLKQQLSKCIVKSVECLCMPNFLKFDSIHLRALGSIQEFGHAFRFMKKYLDKQQQISMFKSMLRIILPMDPNYSINMNDDNYLFSCVVCGFTSLSLDIPDRDSKLLIIDQILLIFGDYIRLNGNNNINLRSTIALLQIIAYNCALIDRRVHVSNMNKTKLDVLQSKSKLMMLRLINSKIISTLISSMCSFILNCNNQAMLEKIDLISIIRHGLDYLDVI